MRTLLILIALVITYKVIRIAIRERAEWRKMRELAARLRRSTEALSEAEKANKENR